ncbi:MAG: xylulokinase [candidate division NC10 bacterium]|nr:xylulokinase [candidate division NC10 bacterium]
MKAGQDSILTYDLGTTAVKAILWTPEGERLSGGEKEYPTLYPRPLWAEQDPEAWWVAVKAATAECLKGMTGTGIIAIGLSSQREGVVAVDRRGQSLGNCIIWMDRRSITEAGVIARHFGHEEIHRRTGTIPDATFTATKLLWLRRNRPALLRKTYRLLQPRDYLYFRLTGTWATDPSLASRTMMFDLRKGAWWPAMFSYLKIPPGLFPEVYPSHQAPARMAHQVARELGLQDGIPVALGGGDRPCEALGGAIAPGQAMESTGTATNISVITEGVPDRLHRAVACSFHVLPGKALLELALPTTGSILRWYRDLVGLEEGFTDLELWAREAPPGAKGLIALPFFMGARSVRWNPEARGLLFGLTLAHTRGDLARAIMEGIAFEERACLEALKGMGIEPREIVALGGGARSDLWNQIKADITGRIFARPRHTEAASLGAMVLAVTSVGAFANPQEAAARLNPPCARFRPRKAYRRLYLSMYEVYNKLYERVTTLFPELAQGV